MMTMLVLLRAGLSVNKMEQTKVMMKATSKLILLVLLMGRWADRMEQQMELMMVFLMVPALALW